MLPTRVLSEHKLEDLARHRRPVTHRADAVLLCCELKTVARLNVRFFPFPVTTPRHATSGASYPRARLAGKREWVGKVDFQKKGTALTYSAISFLKLPLLNADHAVKILNTHPRDKNSLGLYAAI